MSTSPSGKLVCESTGPLDAKIVLVGESPAREEMAASPKPQPFVGPAGRMLNKVLVKAGIDRSQCYIMNCIPVRPNGDKFANHTQADLDWARERFRSEISRLSQARVYVALGANPAEWLLGGKPPVAQRGRSEREGFIGQWRGSVIQTRLGSGESSIPEEYIYKTGLAPIPTQGFIVPTFHPAAVLRQFNWHPWFLLDIQRAAELATKGHPGLHRRKWYFNDLEALKRLAESKPDLLATDTELDPWIVGIATEDEVHVFEWDEKYRHSLTKLLTGEAVKIAHRWLHDWAFFRKCLEIEVEAPLFDLLGGAMALNSALQKELSPHISTRFTWWPYWKWLTNVDQLLYCGMDCVGTFDAYWPMICQLSDRRLYVIGDPNCVVTHDHKLLMPLMKMQGKGFKIDEAVRLEVETDLKKTLEQEAVELQKLVDPIVEKELNRFEKPHLFRVDRKCPCCGGGTKQRIHCWNCCTWSRDHEATPAVARALGFKSLKQWTETWPSCQTCHMTGKIVKQLEFNSDSPDQLADVVYRGLHIRPRKFKGKETVKAAQLDPIKDRHPIIAKVVHVSELRAEYDTVHRLHAGTDGLLHCEFDPWGAETRVASKEGLLEVGTNAQNLPKEARRFVVPRVGYTFLYPDMAQIEARAYCVLSGDKNLRKALYEVLPDLGKADYHTWLLRAIRDFDSRITLSRDQSKRTSYAGFFGVRPEQLAKELSAEAFRKKEGIQVDAKMAQTIIDVLYRICPEVPRVQNAMCEEVMRTRRLKSPTGREFTFVGYIADAEKPGELDYEIRKQVLSRCVQDMAAWVLGLGLIDLYYTSNQWGRLVTPLIHVHDALLIEAPSVRLEEAEALTLKYLTRQQWGMDFPASMKKSNKNWYECS